MPERWAVSVIFENKLLVISQIFTAFFNFLAKETVDFDALDIASVALKKG